MNLGVPVASDPVEHLADWIEFQAIQSPEKNASLQSLISVIRQGGSTDAIGDGGGDEGSVESQRVAQDAFTEIGNRATACGGDGYPFTVEQGLIRLATEAEASPYVLLLLLSTTTPTSGHNGTASLFERLAVHAAHHYLGGPANNARALRFGSPRRAPLAKLCQAIDHLCHNVGEGGGCKHEHRAQHLGDEGLDLIAWRDFPDMKEGKLIAFGQCAGGSGDWEDKLTELDGRKFVQKWFRNMFIVDPIRLFFVPRRIPRDDWEAAGIDGGILFDRCRIVACLKDIDDTLAKDCERTTRKLLTTVGKA